MKRLVVLLLVVALVLVAPVAFGSVNQFESETGLTVEALMLPADPVNETAEEGIVEMVVPTDVVATNTMMIRKAATSTTRVTDRLKYPLSGPP